MLMHPGITAISQRESGLFVRPCVCRPCAAPIQEQRRRPMEKEIDAEGLATLAFEHEEAAVDLEMSADPVLQKDNSDSSPVD